MFFFSKVTCATCSDIFDDPWLNSHAEWRQSSVLSAHASFSTSICPAEQLWAVLDGFFPLHGTVWWFYLKQGSTWAKLLLYGDVKTQQAPEWSERLITCECEERLCSSSTHADTLLVVIVSTIYGYMSTPFRLLWIKASAKSSHTDTIPSENWKMEERYRVEAFCTV